MPFGFNPLMQRSPGNASSLLSRASAGRGAVNSPSALRYVMGKSAGSLNGFGNLRGLGALAPFTYSDMSQEGQNLLAQKLNTVPAGSNGRTLRQLMDSVGQVQTALGPVFGSPEGAQAVASAASLEASITGRWQALRSAVNDRFYLRPPTNGPVGPRPGENYLNNRAADEWDAQNKAFHSDLNHYHAQVASKEGNINAITNELGALLVQYIVTVPQAAQAAIEAINARAALQTAKVQVEVAKEQAVATGTRVDTFVLNQKLKEMEAVANVTAGRAKEAAAAVAAGTGPSLPVIIGGALVLAGVGWFVFRRKK